MDKKYSLGKRFQIIFLIPIAGTLLGSSHSWTIPGLSRPNVPSYPFVSFGNPTVHESISSLLCSKTLADPEKSAASVPTILTTTIAIVGTGAVGGYYGSRLWEAGYNVKFHLRGDHYNHCTIHGLNMTSVEGSDVFIPPDQLQAFEDTHLIGPVDWVICALKSTALDAIPKLIRPLLHSETRILNIMNGLVDDDIVAMINQSNDANDNSNNQISCCAAIYGGMALLCSNRVTTGHIHHSYAGLLSGGLAASRPGTTTQEHEAAFLALWQPSKVPVVYETSLTKGRWKKNIWNLPFNGISVAMGGITIDIIVNDPGLRALAEVIMEEVVTIANTDLKERGYEDTSFHLGKADMKQMMDLSDAMGPYKTSTMLDLVERKPMEVTYLFRKPLQRASEFGISAPHLETIVRMIEAYQQIYRL